MQQEIAELKETLQYIDNFLKGAPKGGLKIQQRLEKTYYYHQYKKDETDANNKKYIKKYIVSDE